MSALACTFLKARNMFMLFIVVFQRWGKTPGTQCTSVEEHIHPHMHSDACWLVGPECLLQRGFVGCGRLCCGISDFAVM